VSETFEKEHAHVLRDIESLDCSENFRHANFGDSFYIDEQRKRRIEKIMTKDGFTFLAMGYRGKKAAAFKEAYIERFNQMEAFIKSLIAAKLEHPAFTEAVMLAHPEPKHYHFSNESDMINRIVLGVSAKQFKEARGLQEISSIRPYLGTGEIQAIETLQRADIGMLAILPEFDKRKVALNALYEKIKTKRLALTA
jgi:Rha family phage regulatory protein